MRGGASSCSIFTSGFFTFLRIWRVGGLDKETHDLMLVNATVSLDFRYFNSCLHLLLRGLSKLIARDVALFLNRDAPGFICL